MWTVDKIVELCKEYCGRCDVVFDSPVVINKRLTTTLGRCFCVEYAPKKWEPYKIEISKQLLDTATNESIEAVIAHECAHYVACKITQQSHGHDADFRFYCSKIGTSNNTAIFHNLKMKSSENAQNTTFKYSVYCSKCKKFIGGKSRSCAVTKNPQNFSSKCCNADIVVEQNW